MDTTGKLLRFEGAGDKMFAEISCTIATICLFVLSFI